MNAWHDENHCYLSLVVFLKFHQFAIYMHKTTQVDNQVLELITCKDKVRDRIIIILNDKQTHKLMKITVVWALIYFWDSTDLQSRFEKQRRWITRKFSLDHMKVKFTFVLLTFRKGKQTLGLMKITVIRALLYFWDSGDLQCRFII